MTLRNVLDTIALQNPAIGPIVKNGVLGTTVNSELVIDVNDASGLTVAMRASATAGGVIAIEGTMDSTNANAWMGLPFVRIDTSPSAGLTSLVTLVANTNYKYRVDTNGLEKVRLRVTTALGAALVHLAYAKHIDTSQLGVAVIPGGTQTVSGSVTATPATPTADNYTSTASTNLRFIKASAGSVYSLVASNPTGTAAYLKLYNKASAPVVATDVPILTLLLPAGGVVNWTAPIGKRFSTGIAMALTGAVADTDATASVAGIKVSTDYI